MKTSLICGAALAILGMAAAPLIAQTQTTSSSTSYVQTSKVIGTKVKTAQGEEIGVVKDVVLDRGNGCMAYTVLSTGGTSSRITGQSKLVAVPWSVYTVSPDAGYLTVNVERDRIYNAPVFEYSRISDTTYTSNIYSHFGVAAGGIGVSSATTTGATTTTTGATTNTGTLTSTGARTGTNSANEPAPPAAGPNASPGSTASVAPTASVSPMAQGSPNPNLTPPANSQSSPPAPDAKATASPRSETRERSRSGESSTSSRHRGEEANQGGNEESTSEATGSSSGKKSSTRKSTDEESSDETGASSSGKKSSHKKSSNEATKETSPNPGE